MEPEPEQPQQQHEQGPGGGAGETSDLCQLLRMFLLYLILIQKRRTGVMKEAGARRGPRTVAVAGAASEDAEAGERREEEA